MASRHGEANRRGGVCLRFQNGEGNAEGLRRNIPPEKIRTEIAEAVGYRRLTARGGDRRGFVIVKVQHRRPGAVDKSAEQGAQFVHGLMIERNIVQHRDFRVEHGDGAVAFVHLADKGVALAHKRAGEQRLGGDEILHHRAVHHRRRRPRMMQYPADHPRRRRLARRAGDADGARGVVEKPRQQFRPGHPRRARRPGGDDIGHRVFHRRGGDQGLDRARQPRSVLRVQRNP